MSARPATVRNSSSLDWVAIGPQGVGRGSAPALNELEVPGTGGTGSDKSETLLACSYVVWMLRGVIFF